jgi:hypothetical protein
MRIAGLVFASALVLVVGWALLYPFPDPKSIEYNLWKVDLCRMDPDSAAVAMTGDANRNKLVLGKTKEQLRHKFGNLQTLDQVSQYYKDGHDAYWKDRDVLFIRNSPWMIVFSGDRATDLVLMKGS